MPRTSQWAHENGLIFTNAFANSTWTRPSHVTMLTGLLPREHGVEYQGSVLPADIPTLPAQLRDLDYFSCACTGSGHVSDYVGMAKDFDSWQQVDNRPGPDYLTTLLRPMALSREVLASPSGRPTFAFIHTYFVHEYYLDESDFAEHSFASLKEWNAYRIDKAHSLRDPALSTAVRQQYSRRVAAFDGILADYLEWLQGSWLGDNLCVIMTSDHGESLYESHLGQLVYGHMGPPNPEKLRVPLVVFGFGPGAIPGLTSLRDLPQMIVHLAHTGQLEVPEHDVIEAEFLTDDRHAEVKTRYTSMVHADGTWVHTRSPGHSLDDDRQAQELPPEHLQQLQALGYVP